ncbi:MAG: hypothetical protein K2I90_12305 [Odoribacter sp.]|nr:hypothetical protein [Odoribacter sp.]
MKYKQWIGICLLVLLTFAYAWYETEGPKEVDWSATYSRKDKIPYGTYILYRSLPHLFPEAEIVPANLDLYEELQKVEQVRNTGYISVSAYFKTDGEGAKRLLEWIGRGNWAFIVADKLQDSLLDALGIALDYAETSGAFKLVYGGSKPKMYPGKSGYLPYFKLPSDFSGEVLGRNEQDSMPHFIRIPYRKGQLLLNLKPVLFTNHAVLDSVRGDYYYQALSFLPADTKKIIWDVLSADKGNMVWGAYGTALPKTPLWVILRYPALKLALYLILAGALLYVFFRARREQRPVPMMLPPRNRMLEFVSTISLLYYKKGEHVSVALKRIDFFLERVRVRYFLRTDNLNDRFAELLAERSGAEREEVEALVRLICRIRERRQVSEEELKQLMEKTEKYCNVK